MLAFVATGCVEDLSDNDHYRPQSSNGNAYQILASEGNHSIFLKGVDLSGYRQIVDGKSILTVMAPDDEKFNAFLAKKGYSSIEELNERDPLYLKKLIGYHLMYYAFDWDKMVNFRPMEGDGASEDDKNRNAGFYYKHRTHSSDPIEQIRVKLTANATSDTLINLYHYERYLPVFSNRFFESKGIDPTYNYGYFYPESTWGKTPSTGKGIFNVSNATVTDADGVVTDNGYLYHIDQVIEPLNTIYDELKKNPKYSDFLALYDKYSTYEEAGEYTNNALGYVAYIHRHGSLPPIACEWGPVTSFTNIASLEKLGYNLFVPSNEALNNFFHTFWSGQNGYSSLQDLDELILHYFIYQSFTNSYFIAFPEEIKNGTVLTPYQTPINIDPDQVTDRKVCVNGALYGMDKLDAPAIFSSVVGPAFKDSTYRNYLYALDGSSLLLSLASNKSQFVTLMPTNQQLSNNEPAIRLYTTTEGKVLQQYSSDAGDYVAMGTPAKANMVNLHTATNVSDIPVTGVHVVKSNMAYNYWYVHNGKITCSNSFNQLLNPENTSDPFVGFHEITDNGAAWDNGKSYAYNSKAPFNVPSGDGLAHSLAVANDKNYCYYMFGQLLQKAGLSKDGMLNASIVPNETRFIVFIPTNEAIKNELTSIPGCSTLKVDAQGNITGTLNSSNKSKLAAYLRNYFITDLQNNFTDYPYSGSSCKGDFFTAGEYKMTINDNGTSLSVHFNEGEKKEVSVSSTYYGFPFAFSDGCFQLIDGILK